MRWKQINLKKYLKNSHQGSWSVDFFPLHLRWKKWNSTIRGICGFHWATLVVCEGSCGQVGNTIRVWAVSCWRNPIFKGLLEHGTELLLLAPNSTSTICKKKKKRFISSTQIRSSVVNFLFCVWICGLAQEVCVKGHTLQVCGGRMRRLIGRHFY